MQSSFTALTQAFSALQRCGRSVSVRSAGARQQRAGARAKLNPVPSLPLRVGLAPARCCPELALASLRGCAPSSPPHDANIRKTFRLRLRRTSQAPPLRQTRFAVESGRFSLVRKAQHARLLAPRRLLDQTARVLYPLIRRSTAALDLPLIALDRRKLLDGWSLFASRASAEEGSSPSVLRARVRCVSRLWSLSPRRLLRLPFWHRAMGQRVPSLFYLSRYGYSMRSLHTPDLYPFWHAFTHHKPPSSDWVVRGRAFFVALLQHRDRKRDGLFVQPRSQAVSGAARAAHSAVDKSFSVGLPKAFFAATRAAGDLAQHGAASAFWSVLFVSGLTLYRCPVSSCRAVRPALVVVRALSVIFGFVRAAQALRGLRLFRGREGAKLRFLLRGPALFFVSARPFEQATHAKV